MGQLSKGPEAPDPRPLRLSRLVLEDLFGPPERRSFAVRFWDGARDVPRGRSPAFELVLRHPGALRTAFLPPTDAAMGRAYVEGDIDIEGDMEAAGRLAEAVAGLVRRPWALARVAARVVRLPANAGGPGRAPGVVRSAGAKHSRARDAAAVRSHYDVGNDFYELFLGRRMVYSCAYFVQEADELDLAQEAKLEHICRKLRLRPGERLLDVGCGWGALVQFAAERHGVEALGITLSEPQAALARERIAAAGLAHRCRIQVLDYRDLPRGVLFDKVASVGMVEHVGRAKLPVYFREIARVLVPGGLFLNHGIVSLEEPEGVLGRIAERVLGPSFMQRFVFPDSELVSPADIIAPGEKAGLELRDVESLREHYARTLRHWVRRLDERRGDAVARVGAETYRVWRLYMSACAGLFSSGGIGVIQALWGKPREDGSLPLPMTRSDLYRPWQEEQGHAGSVLKRAVGR